MKKLICAILALVALLSMGGCNKDKKCTHNWDKATGICPLCKAECPHEWDDTSEFCKVCGMSCLQILRNFVKKSPDRVNNGTYEKELKNDLNNEGSIYNFKLSLNVTDQDISIILTQDWDAGKSTYVNSGLIIKIENTVAKKYYYKSYTEYTYAMGIKDLSAIEGYLVADHVNETSGFSYTKDSHTLKPANREELNESLKEQARLFAAYALRNLTETLYAKNLGFSIHNLGFH